MPSLPSIFRPRKQSLVRSTLLALGSMLFSLRVSGFPDVHPTWWLALPFALACLGTWDTTRCLQRRWSFYHGGVLLLIYVDLMVVIMIAILILAPFSSAIL